MFVRLNGGLGLLDLIGRLSLLLKALEGVRAGMLSAGPPQDAAWVTLSPLEIEVLDGYAFGRYDLRLGCEHVSAMGVDERLVRNPPGRTDGNPAGIPEAPRQAAAPLRRGTPTGTAGLVLQRSALIRLFTR